MLEVREAVAADAAAVASVHVRAWQRGYRGLLPAEYLAELRPEDRAARYSFDSSSAEKPVTLVVLAGGSICGFATIGPAHGDEGRSVGELFALYVDPAQWRKGVARRLISEARGQMAARRFTMAVLWVMVGNERAAAFYAADGWTADGAARQDDVWGVAVDELRYRRALP